MKFVSFLLVTMSALFSGRVGGFKMAEKSNMLLSKSRLMSSWSPPGHNSPTWSGESKGGESKAGSGAVFADYSIYKQKSALAVKPIPPTFKTAGGYKTVAREGALYFEMAPAVGNRQYDWNAKVTFSLSPTECGTLLAADKNEQLLFTHDPNMGSQDAGQVVKRLSVNPAPDGKGIFFRINSTGADKSKVDIPIMITWGELEVIKTIARFSLPRLLGVDKLFERNADE